MTNTQYRILSALFLMIVVAGVVYTGKAATLFFCLIAGLLSIDELLVNFNNYNRKSLSYFSIQFLFLLAFVVFNMLYSLVLTQTLFTIISVFFNLFLIFYLFKIPLADQFMKKSTERYPGIISILIVFPLLSFGMHFIDDSWRKVLLLLLVVTFSMDTGAWFFGKNFGKHKLWPAVSPNKTIEGLVALEKEIITKYENDIDLADEE
jgi:phosphatidate cytidylyltransferase